MRIDKLKEVDKLCKEDKCNKAYNVLLEDLKKITITFYGASVTQQAINHTGEKVGYVSNVKSMLPNILPEYNFDIHQLGFGANQFNDAGYLYFSKLLETSPDIVFLEWHTTALAKFDSAKYDYIFEELLKQNCVVVNLILPFKRCIGKVERENIQQSRFYQSKGVPQVNFYTLMDEEKINKCLRDEVHTNSYGGLEYGKVIVEIIENIIKQQKIVKDTGNIIEPINTYLESPKVSSISLQKDLKQDEIMHIKYQPTSKRVRFFCKSRIGSYSPILDVQYGNKVQTVTIMDQWCHYERESLKAISPLVEEEVNKISFSISRNNPLDKKEFQHIVEKNLNSSYKLNNIQDIYCEGGKIVSVEIKKKEVEL